MTGKVAGVASAKSYGLPARTKKALENRVEETAGDTERPAKGGIGEIFAAN